MNQSGGYETSIESLYYSVEFLPPPELLQWRLLPALLAKIAVTIAHFKQQGDTLRVVVICNKKYGNAWFKQGGLVPDVVVQIEIHLAGIQLLSACVLKDESGHTDAPKRLGRPRARWRRDWRP